MEFTPTGIKGVPSQQDGLKFSTIEPSLAGYFSVGKNREYRNSAENLLYFRMPTKYPLNLNASLRIGERINEIKQKELLTNLLQFICHNRNEMLSKSPNATTADFVCFRGVLRIIMGTPFEPKCEWSILATRYKNKIYLFEKEKPRTNEETLYAYSINLKRFCFTQNPLKEWDTSDTVDEREEFYMVFNTKFCGMDLLYCASIDGALPMGRHDLQKNISKHNGLNLSALNIVDLKCCIRPTNRMQESFFKAKKCLNWWSQSILVGMKDILIAYRNAEGFVDEIKHMDVNVLPQMGMGYWSAEQCTDFLKKFLEDVKFRMKNVNCPNTVYEFYFDPISRNIYLRKHPGKSSLSMLPRWYIAMSQKQS